MASEPQHLVQNSALSSAQPAYVLRGHSAQIHSVHFFRQNLRLLSSDADGWVVLWSIPIKRPVAVWQAHKGTVLGLGSWGDDRIITHGRDSKLHVWQLSEENESTFSTILPIDNATVERRQPWLLHSLTINPMNFCSFATCAEVLPDDPSQQLGHKPSSSILVATPGIQDGYINVTPLPNETRIATIPTPKDVNTGMVMTIGLHYYNNALHVLAGYESGHAAIWQRNSTNRWQTVYVNKSHTQPILSLDVSPVLDCFFTSSADAIIACHPLTGNHAETKTVQTKHAGQQSLAVRSDYKILATAGWDGRVRVYSPKSMKELAVLKWHKEGCYAIAFAEIMQTGAGNHLFHEGEEGITKRDLTVSEQRTAKAKSTHWLAAGSKDGKVSLWDIY